MSRCSSVLALCALGACTVPNTYTPSGSQRAPGPGGIAPARVDPQGQGLAETQAGRRRLTESEAMAEMRLEADQMLAALMADREDDDGEIRGRFADVYGRRGAPRIAVFLNRSVSDDVLEWRTHQSIHAAPEQPPVVVEIKQRQALGGERPNPAEAWMWAFEDGFMTPLLNAGVGLVDRATIMRLAAHADGGTGESESPLTVRHIEVGALLDHADFFVELLVQGGAGAPVLRARLIEVATGRVVAHVTSDGMPPPPPRLPVLRRDIVRVTESGYRFDQVSIDPNEDVVVRLPGPGRAAERLALTLMGHLADRW